MTHTTTPDPTTPEPTVSPTPPAPRGLIPLSPGAGLALVLLGGAGTIASAFMSWTWTSEFPGDLTVYGYPAGLQILAIVAGVLTLFFGATRLGLLKLPGAERIAAPSALFAAALSAFTVCWFAAIAIAVDLGGLANLDPGAYVAAVASALALAGALTVPAGPDGIRAYLSAADLGRITVPANPWVRRLVITLGTAAALIAFTYGIGIDSDDSETFVGFVLLLAFALLAFNRSGLLARYTAISTHHKGFAVALAFLAAVIFPFTQSDDHNANLGVNILTFGTVALGLNIVVGLTGLLDLGYVAFLGVGSYTAALVSGSEYSRFSGTQFPFWAAALTGMAVTLVFGVLIGAPTLRLRGDYLAIVTLGFGEIFRIAVNNLDGSSGPNITNGPNGISRIPDLEIFGFNLGDSHDVAGFTLGRFSNYFFLMLFVTAIVVLVFTRAADSRIGRSWIAIREDETAATAMGINGFRVKLVAFALGASLAGLAGTVGAHVSYSVNPAPYQFAGAAPPNSAFLLAAVVLGGMGTVNGPLLGAALLYLIPEKLGFLQNYELFAFGIALVLLMRFRPEGVIANRRRQLEFHEIDQLDVPERGLPDSTLGVTKAGA
ncbi:branched-chain amino acid transport system permease protein [Streptomyces sp. B3I7]|uniref:branched-chain amino acid ABC transporter permease n=1 Tax=unclassified Streptomyces TaxID=2593676 RepID=UPI002785F07C|nr:MULTISPECIES: branched-chain amino acid ABC transporter permease [unclassified Streptomyces]MDQ0786364.1 branched-chain amino acid transport system permease protein [Streptomyces sp. B3I8]MDQ0814029.1 branched-chain amino acid transport system permease protein [Streptomyces sp. B3I7]